MMNKKLISGLLCTALIASVSVTALADDAVDTTLDTTPAVEESAAAVSESITGTYATVQSVEQSEEGSVTSITVQTELYDSLVLLVGEGTVCIDTQTGVAASLQELEVGDEIYAYISEAVTASLPAQTSVEAIVVNLDESSVPAHYLTAEQVTANEDGSVTILCDNGGTLLTVTADTPISPYLTKNIVSLSDIEEGSRFFAWYEVVALSYPGQATAERVVLLPAEAAEEETAADEESAAEETAISDGETGDVSETAADETGVGEDRELTMIVEGDIAIGQARVENGVVMVPLRLVSETVGCTVEWAGEDKTVTVTGENGTLSVTIGSTEAQVNDETVVMAAEAALEEPGTTWIALETLELVTGTAAEVNGDSLVF